MAIIDSQKIDFLWKKIVYGVTETSATLKGGANETIGSPLPTYSKNIWAQDVPSTAPGATTSVVRYYPSNNAIQLMKDPTVSGGNTWVAVSTMGDLNTRVGDWVSPSIDATYLVDIYKNDSSVPANKLNSSTSGTEWVFDYQAGVLHFPNSAPVATTMYMVGYRYIGGKGTGGAGMNVADHQVIYNGASVNSGVYTFSGFFGHNPQTNTVTAYFNGVRLNDVDFTYGSGTDLTINVDNLPYPLESGDVISARYSWAG